eukprot:m.159972 g.159972  ORF g.159972 m.159972 type:complete len:894 (-) comp14344_c0_seq1:1687-4368(-)
MAQAEASAAPKQETPKTEEVPDIQDEDLSEDDRALKEMLEENVALLEGSDTSVHEAAAQALRESIRTATSSMTSVPKPLKFLRPHYDRIKAIYAGLTDDKIKALASDIVSLVAMTVENDEARECLNFRFTGAQDPVATWGHEYVRHLQKEIADEYADRVEREVPLAVDNLVDLANEIVPYCVQNNAEPDACDLLMEIERMDLLEAHVDESCYDRVCLYLMSCVPFVAEPEDTQLLKTCLAIFRKFAKFPQAMQVALRLNDVDMIMEIFKECSDCVERRQLAFMLGRQQMFFDVEELLEDVEEDEDEIERLKSLVANSFLNENFLSLARDLDILEPKTPEDIYKSRLDDLNPVTQTISSARVNLGSTFVNAFVNAGFGMDSLIMGEEQGSRWLYKNKGRGMMSATASLGMVLLWDVDEGLTRIDAHVMSDKDEIKAGALLGIGMVNSTVRDENEPALALLQDYVSSPKGIFRIGANMGLGLAYAGTANEDVTELLLPVLSDPSANAEVVAVTALALGQIHVGRATGDVSEAILTCILSDEKRLEDPYSRFLPVALGLVYLGKQQEADVVKEALKTLPGSFGKLSVLLVDALAYAGTGNMLKIQEMLHICSEHFNKEEKEGEEKIPDDVDLHQAYATVGIALIAMGEEVSVEMALRSMRNLLQYGEPAIRRAVPVAMAILSASNPQLGVIDLLSKLSHDPDQEVAYNSILAMGIVGAGTNHAHVGGLLRTLARYYSKDAEAVLLVRIAQGLLYVGKGSMTISPFHSERTLMSGPAAAGLLSCVLGFLDVKNIFLQDGHYMLFNLAIAMYPRILALFDEELEPVQLTVRVGQAVDVVGQAGKPKTITGFITNDTPVLLGYGERAQFASEEYESLTPILEGFVIVRKKEDEEQDAAA